MNCRISFKHMKRSQALAEYAESKIIPKVAKYSTKPIDTHITFSAEGKSFSVHCVVNGGDGFNYQLESESLDMHSTVDSLADKLESLLRKHKERIKQHKHTNTIKHMALAPEVDEYGPIDAEDLIKYERSRLMKHTG
jgi:putative sigma-54 modulation protein